MTTAGLKGWETQTQQKPAWRVERAPAAAATMPFFPDQNGGVYEKLLNNLPVMLHTMDGSGRMISANAAWCAALGYSANDIVGRAFSEFLPMESRSKLVTEIYPKFLTTSSYRNGELLIHRKDGSLATILLSMTAYRGDKGRLERSVCTLEDITERKVAEIATARVDTRFRSAFVAAAQGIAVVSPTGHIEVANTSLATLLQRDDLESRHVSFEELIHKDDRPAFLNSMRELLTGKLSVMQQELRLVTGQGKTIHGAVSIALVKNDLGETEQLIVQISDVSQRREVNERLQKAQKMEAIGQLTGGLAHDFNNLLTVIIGNLQLLDGKFPAEDKSTRRLSEAVDAARKGSELTRQLLAIARKQELEPRDVEVNTLVKAMEPLLSRSIGENINLKVETMPGTPHVMIDPSQLESAILNLAINARDAMDNGGMVTIETQPAYLDQFYAEKHPEVVPGHYVMVAVTDTGHGMTPELIEKVFQPFFTTKAPGKGSGLGLSMVYGFIKQSGGHISVYSEVGHGTSFKMYLPRKLAHGEAVNAVANAVTAIAAKEAAHAAPAPMPIAAAPAADVPVQPVASRKAKILVVEDQEAVRAVACGFLEDFGYDVIEAGDGFQALAVLQEVEDIDLMFSDVVMPGGMNGFDLAQAAQSLKPELKIVHTSGYPKGAMVHQDEPRFKEGFIIMKPYRRDDLQKIIKDALDKQ
ncbi:MAG: PAS domain S-box protein [Alphaproteobacteria bacterium]|nr:PAS domain S-box protein [Alphaproteobacteria bacterium]